MPRGTFKLAHGADHPRAAAGTNPRMRGKGQGPTAERNRAAAEQYERVLSGGAPRRRPVSAPQRELYHQALGMLERAGIPTTRIRAAAEAES